MDNEILTGAISGKYMESVPYVVYGILGAAMLLLQVFWLLP